MTQPTPVQTELAAMRRIVAVLDALDPDTRRRVFGWLVARYAPLAEQHVSEETR